MIDSTYIEKIATKFDKIEVIRLNNTDFLDLAKNLNVEIKNVSFSFSFLGNILPKIKVEKKQQPLYFEHLSQISKGSNKLGIFKADVDNLGLIFSMGFEHLKNEPNNLNKIGSSISRISTLSFYLEMFISGFINQIASNYKVYEENKLCKKCKLKLKENKLREVSITFDDKIEEFDMGNDEYREINVICDDNNEICSNCHDKGIPTLYINYSGGDDLLVFGPYDQIIQFAEEFRSKFKEWTSNNRYITLSAGINIVNSKFPIGRAVQMSENYLNKSKCLGKDKITVFNETVSWENDSKDDRIKGFNSLLYFSKNLENIVPEKVSKGFVYSMLQLWQEYYFKDTLKVVDELDWESMNICRISKHPYVPMYVHKLRNIKDLKIRKKFREEYWKYLPWIRIPASWIGLRQR
ncbi:type III-A CRISPR-associated protein Cas10/Csm1 [Methanobrevibacter filiformis]|uniref:GGDEF domain-containing protein n=1 Tax=Methanobrevibacter filiformis TaxID=55758 RepID=A0A166CYY5_9EURY|nr:hypothetical protein [Methanobrevibacter filiformis]KZX17627.1 hypothetical protein MBFIL_00370 [Methanobrevibacter filiformis]